MLSWWRKRQQKKTQTTTETEETEDPGCMTVKQNSKETQLDQPHEIYGEMMHDHPSLKVPPTRLSRQTGKWRIVNQKQSTALMHRVEDDTSSKITRTSDDRQARIEAVAHVARATDKPGSSSLTNLKYQAREFTEYGARIMEQQSRFGGIGLALDSMSSSPQDESKEVGKNVNLSLTKLDTRTVAGPIEDPNDTNLNNEKVNADSDYTVRNEGIAVESEDKLEEANPREGVSQLDLDAIRVLIEQDIQRQHKELNETRDTVTGERDDDIDTSFKAMIAETQTHEMALSNQLQNESMNAVEEYTTFNEGVAVTSEGKLENMVFEVGKLNLDLEPIGAPFDYGIKGQIAETYSEEYKIYDKTDDPIGTTTFNTAKDYSKAMEWKQPQVTKLLKHSDNEIVNAGTDYTTGNGGIDVNSKDKLEQMNPREEVSHVDLGDIGILLEQDIERQSAEINEKRDKLAVGNEDDAIDAISKAIIEETQTHEMAWSKQLHNESVNAVTEYTTLNEGLPVTLEGKLEHMELEVGNLRLALEAIGAPIDYGTEEQNTDIYSVEDEIPGTINDPMYIDFCNSKDYSNIMEKKQLQLNSQSLNVDREYIVGNEDNVPFMPESNLEHRINEMIEYDELSSQSMSHDLAVMLGFSSKQDIIGDGEESSIKLVESEPVNLVKEYTILNEEALIVLPEARGKTRYSQLQHFNPELDLVQSSSPKGMTKSDEGNKLHEEKMADKELPQLYSDQQIINEFREQLVNTGVPEPIINELIEFHKQMSTDKSARRLDGIQNSPIKKKHERTLKKLFAEQYTLEKPDTIVQEYKEYKETVKRINKEYAEKQRKQEAEAQTEHYEKTHDIKEQLKTAKKSMQQNPMQAEHAELVQHLKEQIRNLDIIEGQRRTQALKGNKDLKHAKYLCCNQEKHKHLNKLFVLWKEHYRIDEAEYTLKRVLQPGFVVSKNHVSSKDERKHVKRPSKQKYIANIKDNARVPTGKRRKLRLQVLESDLDDLSISRQEDMNESDEEDKLYEEEVEDKEPCQFQFDERLINEFHGQLLTTRVPEPIIKELVRFHKKLSIHVHSKRFQQTDKSQSKKNASSDYEKKDLKIRNDHRLILDKLFAKQYKREKPNEIVQEYERFNELRNSIIMEYKEKKKEQERIGGIQGKQGKAEHDRKANSIKEKLKTVKKKMRTHPMQTEHAEMAEQLKEELHNLDIEDQSRKETLKRIKDLTSAQKQSCYREKKRHLKKLSVLWKKHYRIADPSHRKKGSTVPGFAQFKRHEVLIDAKRNIKSQEDITTGDKFELNINSQLESETLTKPDRREMVERKVEDKEPHQLQLYEQLISKFHKQLVTTEVPEPIIEELVRYHTELNTHINSRTIGFHSQSIKDYGKQNSKIRNDHRQRLDKLFAEQYKREKPNEIVQEYERFKERKNSIIMEYKEKKKEKERIDSIQEKQAKPEHDRKAKCIKGKLKTVKEKMRKHPNQTEHAEMADQLKEELRDLDVTKDRRKKESLKRMKDLTTAQNLSCNCERKRHLHKLSILWKEHYRIEEPSHRKNTLIVPGYAQTNMHGSLEEDSAIGKMSGQHTKIEKNSKFGVEHKMTAMHQQPNNMTGKLLNNRTSIIEITKKETGMQIGRVSKKRQAVVSPIQVDGQQNQTKKRQFEGTCNRSVRQSANRTGDVEQPVREEESMAEDSHAMDILANCDTYSAGRESNEERQNEESGVDKREAELRSSMDAMLNEFQQKLVKTEVPQPIIQELVRFHEDLNEEKYKAQTMRYREHEAQHEYDRHRLRLQQVINEAAEMNIDPTQLEAVQKTEQELIDIEHEEIGRRRKAHLRLLKASKDYSKISTIIRHRHMMSLSKLFTKQFPTEKPEAVVRQNSKFEKYWMEEKLKLKETRNKVIKQYCEAQQIHSKKLDSLNCQLAIAKSNIQQEQQVQLANKLTDQIHDLETEESNRDSKTMEAQRDITKAYYKIMNIARHNNKVQLIILWKKHYGIEEPDVKLEPVPLYTDIGITGRSTRRTEVDDPVRGNGINYTNEIGANIKQKDHVKTGLSIENGASTVIDEGECRPHTVLRCAQDMKAHDKDHVWKDEQIGSQEQGKPDVQPQQYISSQWKAQSSAVKVTKNEAEPSTKGRQRKRRAGQRPNITEHKLTHNKRRIVDNELVSPGTVAGETYRENDGQQGKDKHTITKIDPNRRKIVVKKKDEDTRDSMDERISQLAGNIMASKRKASKSNMALTALRRTSRESTRVSTKASTNAAYQQRQTLIDKRKKSNMQNQNHSKPTNDCKYDTNKHAIDHSKDREKTDKKNKAFQERHHESQHKEAKKKQAERINSTQRKNEKKRDIAERRKEEQRSQGEQGNVSGLKEPQPKQDEHSQKWKTVITEFENKYC